MSVSENEIRTRVKASAARLAQRFVTTPLSVVEELEVGGGAARIDIAFVGDRLIGIEIKSPNDTLYRLKRQADFYAPFFDFLLLVTDADFVDSAKKLLPNYWGIISINAHESSPTTYHQLRRPELNPASNPAELLQLLWKDELIGLLHDEDAPAIENARLLRISKANLRQQIIERLDGNTIRSCCMDVLTKRENWRIKRLGAEAI